MTATRSKPTLPKFEDDGRRQGDRPHHQRRRRPVRSAEDPAEGAQPGRRGLLRPARRLSQVNHKTDKDDLLTRVHTSRRARSPRSTPTASKMLQAAAEELERRKAEIDGQLRMDDEAAAEQRRSRRRQPRRPTRSRPRRPSAPSDHDDRGAMRAAPDLGNEPPDWTGRAGCRGMASTTFFTSKGSNGTDAKRVCDRCLVRGACLDYVMDVESRIAYRHGIWGGLTPLERRRLCRAGWRPGDQLPDVRFPKSDRVA
jgi:WhiB family redox-sensing transcriptional regulator